MPILIRSIGPPADLGVPVVDHWRQTETGFAIAANPMGIERLPFKSGSPTVVMPGYDLRGPDEGGHESPGNLGAFATACPFPPGTLPTLWGAEARFHKGYLAHFPGYDEISAMRGLSMKTAMSSSWPAPMT